MRKGNMAEALLSPIGSVLALWRYPIKSMLGEETDQAHITERGLIGDRAYAVIEKDSGKIASAKYPLKWGNLLSCRALTQANNSSATVQVIFPNGLVLPVGEDKLNEQLSEMLGRQVTLESTRPQTPMVENVDPFTDTITDIGAFMLRDGFTDYAPLHLLTTASLQRLGKIYSQGQFSVQRYRPNLVIKSNSEQIDFIENSWVGKTVAIGNEVRLRITDPAPRCIMTTLAQEKLNNDLDLLRTVVQHNQVSVPALQGKRRACLGVYAFVLQGGAIRKNDVLRIEN